MGLFSKKKGKEGEGFDFGFPQEGGMPPIMQRRREDMASMPSAEETEMPPKLPELKRELPPPPPRMLPKLEAREEVEEEAEVKKPELKPIKIIKKPVIEEEVTERAERAMPEEISAPKIPEISIIRPHIYLKIDKYKQVMQSIDKFNTQINSIKRTIETIKDLSQKEDHKIKETETVLAEIEQVINMLDKIFTTPEK